MKIVKIYHFKDIDYINQVFKYKVRFILNIVTIFYFLLKDTMSYTIIIKIESF